MLKLSWKFGESKWNPCWVLVLTSSPGTNYVPNEHDDFDQYGSFSILSELVLYIKAILQVWWTKTKSLLSYRVNELIWH